LAKATGNSLQQNRKFEIVFWGFAGKRWAEPNPGKAL
jgi:hypothetical protein